MHQRLDFVIQIMATLVPYTSLELQPNCKRLFESSLLDFQRDYVENFSRQKPPTSIGDIRKSRHDWFGGTICLHLCAQMHPVQGRDPGCEDLADPCLTD